MIGVDQYAISRGIWHIYPASGIRFPINLFGNHGIQLEQVLVYSLTTIMVVSTLHPMLLITDCYYGKNGGQGSWMGFAKAMVWSDGRHDGGGGLLPSAAPRGGK